MTRTGRIREERNRVDFLVRLAGFLFILGLFASSLLVLRVGGTTIGDLLMISSALVLSLSAKKPEMPGPSHIFQVLVVLMIVTGGGLASIVSQDTADSLMVMLRVIYVVAILPWQARILLNTPKRLANGLLSFALGAAVCGLGGVLQVVAGADVIPGGQVTIAGRFSGFTGHVSDTGIITALAVIFGVAALGARSRDYGRFLPLFILTGGIAGLILSGSVSGMLATGLGTLVILALRGVSVGRIFLVAVAAGVGLYWATGTIGSTANALSPSERVLQVLGITGSEESLNTTSSRWETDLLGWQGFLHAPLTGVGLDAQSSIVTETLSVHNFLLAAMYQGGAIFSLGLVVAIVTGIRQGWRHRSDDSISVAILAMTAATLVFSMTAPSFYNRYFWIPLALLAAHVAIKRSDHLPGESAESLTIGSKQWKSALR